MDPWVDNIFSGVIDIFWGALGYYAVINGINLVPSIPSTAAAIHVYGMFLVVFSLIPFLFYGIYSI